SARLMQFAETRSNVYSEAFHAWKNARDKFSTAAKEFVDACWSFEAVCLGPPGRNTTRSMLEEVLAALDFELPELTPSFEKATNANNVMKVLRNKSTTLVPISTLPSELLMHIFELLCHSYTNNSPSDNSPKSPIALACVSTYWRQLTLNNSHLWTRIDLTSSKELSHEFHERAKTQIKYVRESFLDVTIHGERGWNVRPDIEKMTELLAQAAPRLGSLTCKPEVIIDLSLQRILSTWVQHAVPGSVYALHLLGCDQLRHDIRIGFPQPMTRIEEFFIPIRYLTLHHLFVDWSSALYHNVVELDLSYVSSFVEFPTVAQFSAVLSASPSLRALKLCGFGLKPPPPLDVVRPVRLEHLEVLFMKSIHRCSLKLLLPLLQPGSAPLYVRFELPGQGVDFAHYLQLLRRSHVVKLMVEGTGEYPSQPPLASLAGVQHVFLVNFVIDPIFFESMVDPLIPYDKEQHATVWPSLRNLHLMDCLFKGSDYGHFIDRHIPYQFMVWIWDFDGFYREDGYCMEPNSAEAKHILNILSSYIPGMQDIPLDRKLMSDAWKAALDFAELD
ncbi:hypothetical protein FRC10_007269, partial [Ceratobasidium sp. 414]